MIRIPYGKTYLEIDEKGAPVLSSRISELKAEEPARKRTGKRKLSCDIIIHGQILIHHKAFYYKAGTEAYG